MSLKGNWGENISWELIFSHVPPPADLITAVFGVCLKEEKVLLTKNNRGWELPGGHIEKGESINEGLQREVLEETGYVISTSRQFALRKIRSMFPTKRDKSNSYPHPISYTAYYICELDQYSEKSRKLADDVISSEWINITDINRYVAEEGLDLINTAFKQWRKN